MAEAFLVADSLAEALVSVGASQVDLVAQAELESAAAAVQVALAAP